VLTPSPRCGWPRYADLRPQDLPIAESLQDTMQRTLPLWNDRILRDLRAGRTVMVVAHANSLRGILKHIDTLTPEQIQAVGIPNGIPLVGVPMTDPHSERSRRRE
jgi:2,3-bisphosphoglycerate-dependent phosphoglycerate mutase